MPHPTAAAADAATAANAADGAAPDAATVELKLSAPSGALLSSLANIAIVPRGHEADKDTLGKTPIGTGPFKFAEWKRGEYIKLDRFADYASHVVRVGRAEFIEIGFVAPSRDTATTFDQLDAIREEIAVALGGLKPGSWLTVDFTADKRWI